MAFKTCSSCGAAVADWRATCDCGRRWNEPEKRSGEEARVRAAHLRRAGELRSKIASRTRAFALPGLGAWALGRIASGAIAGVALAIGGVVLLTLFVLRRGWISEYRAALQDAGIDPDQDETIQKANAGTMLLWVFAGVIGGFLMLMYALSFLKK